MNKIITSLGIMMVMATGCHYNVDDMSYRDVARQHVEECEGSGQNECPTMREVLAQVREDARIHGEKMRAQRRARLEAQARNQQRARNAYYNSCAGQYSRITRGRSSYGAVSRYVSQCR